MTCYDRYITDELLLKGLCFYIHPLGRHSLKDYDGTFIAGGCSSDSYYASGLIESIIKRHPSIKVVDYSN